MKEAEEQKQHYLRENILNKGYDANEFMDFFKESTGTDDLNLNDFTMEEIEKVVNDFYSRKVELNPQQNSKDPQIPNELRSEFEQDNNNIDISNSTSSSHNENNSEEMVKCIQIENRIYETTRITNKNNISRKNRSRYFF